VGSPIGLPDNEGRVEGSSLSLPDGIAVGQSDEDGGSVGWSVGEALCEGDLDPCVVGSFVTCGASLQDGFDDGITEGPFCCLVV